MQADFINGRIKVHSGCFRGGVRPVLLVGSSGLFVRLESWDKGELVNAEEIDRFGFDKMDLAQAAYLALVQKIQAS